MKTEFISLLVLTFISGSILRHVAGTETDRKAHYRKIANHKVQSSSVPLQSSTFSKAINPLECAAICLGLPNCNSYDLHTTSASCLFYQWKLFSIPSTTDILVYAVGWNHYDKEIGKSHNMIDVLIISINMH